jgi:hypothetical protein
MVNMLSHSISNFKCGGTIYTFRCTYSCHFGRFGVGPFDMMKLINIGKMMIILLMLTPCVTRKELCFICLTN